MHVDDDVDVVHWNQYYVPLQNIWIIQKMQFLVLNQLKIG